MRTITKYKHILSCVCLYFFSVWCLFSGFKQHRNVWHIVGSQHTIVVDLYVFVETTIETYTILRKWAFAIGFFYPTDIFFDSSYVLRFTWIYYYHYFTLEFPFLRLHAVFKPNVWSLFVIFVVYLFCQKPERGSVCVVSGRQLEAYETNRIKRFFMAQNMLLFAIYIRSTYLFFVLLALLVGTKKNWREMCQFSNCNKSLHCCHVNKWIWNWKWNEMRRFALFSQ